MTHSSADLKTPQGEEELGEQGDERVQQEMGERK